MCLISIAPKGTVKDIVKLQSFIEQGMSSNTDGSGYAIKKDGNLFFSKGYRSPTALVDAIKSHNLGLDDELMIHHRTGTSGKKDNINMHPFLVTEDEDELKTTDGLTDKPIMAHNGVFGAFSDYNSDYSDTYHFIRDFMSTPEFVSYLIREPEKFYKKVKPVINHNKLAFLFKERDLVLLGDFTEDDGFYHSNGGYKKYVFDRGGSSCNLPSQQGGAWCRRGSHFQEELDYALAESEYADNDVYQIRTNTHKSSSINRLIDNYPKLPSYGIDTRLEKDISTINDVRQLSIKNLKFDSDDIGINENNWKHFIFVIKEEGYNGWIQKYKGYEIESFDKDDELTPILCKSSDRIIHHVNFKTFQPACDIFVKNEFRLMYTALFKLINDNGYRPSQSLMKKVEKILARKFQSKTFKFKDYGVFNWFELNHYYHKAKLTKREQSIEDIEAELNGSFATVTY